MSTLSEAIEAGGVRGRSLGRYEDAVADGDLEHYQWALRQYAAELTG